MPDSDTWQIVAPLAGDRSLRGLAAVKRLRPEQRDKLQRRLQSREYRRADVIYHPDDDAGSLYVVLAGVVRLSIVSPNGRRVLLNLLPAGEIFGHTALVDAGFTRVFEAAAYTDVRVGRIGAADFFEALAGPHAGSVAEAVSFVTERWITLVLRLARFGFLNHENVRRLQVTVYDAVLMRVMNRVADFREQLQPLPHG